jgi:FG-GAP-like repeat
LSAHRLGAALCLLLSLFGCTTFPVIEADVCGNKVIEDGEDCDTFSGAGRICRAPGTVDECHFDCRLNADNTRGACPPDTGCAADGICRKPTGKFESGVNFAPGASSWLSTADFDGDTRLDVISTEAEDELQQARFRIHYFDADSKLDETRTFPRVVTRPIARQLTTAADGTAQDLIFSNDQIGMVAGRADREWVPAAFSSYGLSGTHLVVTPLRTKGITDVIGLAVFTVLEEGPGVYVQTPGQASKLSLLAPVTLPLDDLAGQPVSAEIVTTADSPCTELVFAFRGDDSVHMLDLCEPGTDTYGVDAKWRDQAREQIVHLPGGATVSAAPITADVDGDGHLDILIGSEGRTFFARGDGAGLESEASLLMVSPLLKDATGSSAPFPLATPLAAGDLTGDGEVDFVLPTGILASHHSAVDGRLGYTESYHNRAQPWSMAVLRDLNANGLPDVIAATQGVPNLSFISGTGDLSQVVTRLPTRAPVRLLATGDFDGDRVVDVAYVESGPARSDDSLVLAFGRRDSIPEDGRQIAGIAGVEQLGSAEQGGVDSVFTVSKRASDGVTRSTFSLFDSSPDRLPFAAYALVTFSMDHGLDGALARVLAAGSFTARGTNDLVVMSGEQSRATPTDVTQWGLWLVPDIGGGDQPPRRLAPDTVPPDAVPVTFHAEGGRLSATALAADLDHDDLDEALLLMPLFDRVENAVLGCALLVYDIDAKANTATSKSVVRFSEPCPDPQLSKADLDGDGGIDLLVLIGDPGAGPRQLRLMFNDGHGGFSLDRSSLVGVGQHDVRGASMFDATPKHVAFVTEEGLYLARADGDARVFDHVTRLQDFQDAHSVVVTDPNGDKIQDIVVGDAAGLWLVGAQLR